MWRYWNSATGRSISLIISKTHGWPDRGFSPPEPYWAGNGSLNKPPITRITQISIRIEICVIRVIGGLFNDPFPAQYGSGGEKPLSGHPCVFEIINEIERPVAEFQYRHIRRRTRVQGSATGENFKEA